MGIIWDPRYPPMRDVIPGLADYIRQHEPWELYSNIRMQTHSLGPLEKWDGDGLIGAFFPGRDRGPVWNLVRRGMPVVNIGGGLQDLPADPHLAHVYVQNETVGRLAAEHLLGLGYRNFAAYRIPIWHATGRCAGFQRRIVEAGFQCVVRQFKRRQICSPDGRVNPRGRSSRWLKELTKPVGIFVADDNGAARLIRAALGLGFRIPQDIAVIGCGNECLMCAFALVSLSSVQLPYHAIGYRGAEVLDRMMRGQKAPKKFIELPPGDVVQRRSTDIAGDIDPEVTAALHFIRENAYRPLHVDDVLEQTKVSRRTLQGRFRQIVGRGLYQEIQRLRIQKAQQLLSETALPLKKIAAMSGFSDARNLCIVFGKKLGETPSQYRLRHHIARV